MALNLPVYKNTDLVIVDKDSKWRAKWAVDDLQVLALLEKGMKLIASPCLLSEYGDSVPIIITSRTLPSLFLEGGIYFENNPIPYLVTPVLLPDTDIYVYHADFL